jgi:DnaJ-domain-containing protein 1
MTGCTSRFLFLRLLALCIALASTQLASAGKDHYKVLGVDRSVDDRSLKKAYRALAL